MKSTLSAYCVHSVINAQSLNTLKEDVLNGQHNFKKLIKLPLCVLCLSFDSSLTCLQILSFSLLSHSNLQLLLLHLLDIHKKISM